MLNQKAIPDRILGQRPQSLTPGPGTKELHRFICACRRSAAHSCPRPQNEPSFKKREPSFVPELEEKGRTGWLSGRGLHGNRTPSNVLGCNVTGSYWYQRNGTPSTSHDSPKRRSNLQPLSVPFQAKQTQRTCPDPVSFGAKNKMAWVTPCAPRCPGEKCGPALIGKGRRTSTLTPGCRANRE